MKTMFLFMALALSFYSGICQSTCGNLDFENGNFDNWKTYVGNTDNIDTLSVQSFDPYRFAIMSGGYDSISGYTIPMVAPGGTFSCRLGNSNVGAEAEKMTYTLNVSEENALFIYKYAIVLEDPGHLQEDQPQFEVKILNENGEIMDPTCGYYQVSAASDIPGFQNNGIIVYKNWTTVGIDLTPYIGQIVTICFITKDCTQGGHFGYAYIDAEYFKMEIKTFACAGNDSIVMSAPFGFEYLWQPRGYTGEIISVAANEAEESYTCTLTSVTGCQVVLNASTEIISLNPNINYVSCDTVWFTGGNLTDIADIVTWNWNFGDGQTGFGINPFHVYNGQGPFNVQLIITTSTGCSASTTKNVKVIAKPVAKIYPVPTCAGISGKICEQSEKVIPGVTTYLWNFGDGTFSSIPDPTKIYDSPGTYTILLTLMNGPYCKDIATVEMEIANCEVQVPNVLTPNSDGLNETFYIKNLDACNAAKLTVFNRWGNLIYLSDNYCNSWQPKDLTPGVYYYVFEYSPLYPRGFNCSKTGFVTIFK
jgi:gliding motility-associated-like protein